MKNFIRTSAVLCAALCISYGSSVTPARADENPEATRVAQMRLASLGYYVGHYDGKMGPMTEAALMDFQRNNHLPMNGKLTAETYTMLGRNELNFYPTQQTIIPVERVAYSDMYVMPAPINWDNRWHYNSTQVIPNRFARVDLHERNYGSLRHYTMTVNGRNVLLANNQTGVMRVSQPFHMQNQDALVITAYQGDPACAYRNYVMTLNKDGSFTMPREIGNCSGSFDAKVADNTLLLNFTGTDLAYGWRTWDVWRLQDGLLAHI